jgi:hypothetical protein
MRRNKKNFHEQEKNYKLNQTTLDHGGECSRPVLQQKVCCQQTHHCLLNGGHTLCAESSQSTMLDPSTPCTVTCALSCLPVLAPAMTRHQVRSAGHFASVLSAKRRQRSQKSTELCHKPKAHSLHQQHLHLHLHHCPLPV